MMNEQLDIFEASESCLCLIFYKHVGGRILVADRQVVSHVELNDILEDWDYYETVLDTDLYVSKEYERKFMTVAERKVYA